MKKKHGYLWIGTAGALLAAVSSLAVAADADWRLSFEDNFDRAELGGDWDIYWGDAKIVNGRMHMAGGVGPPVLLIKRSFPSDVRLEFEAEVDPAFPPCDLACGLAGNRFVGYGYLLQFGGDNNQCNRISASIKGRGKKHQLQYDMKPPFAIELHKVYKCVATLEGRHITFVVNGVKLLDVVDDDDPLGGPPLDGVSLVTWNGMFVDNVKVYERKTPAPNGPVFIDDPKWLDIGYRWRDRILSYKGKATLSESVQRGIEAYNNRKYAEAIDLLAGITPPTLESVVALAYVVGDPAYNPGQKQSEADQKKVAQLATEVARNRPDDRKAATFALLADWFQQVTIASRDKQNTERIYHLGPDNNPFYYKNQLFRARFQLAIGQESGYQRNRTQAMDLFAALKEMWPDHAGIAQLTGEKMPWGPELIRADNDGPKWARNLQEGLARQHAVLNWWFTERQAEDGQLGGGWGDDVELLRSWGMPACITPAGETVIAGIQRLADGTWKYSINEMEPREHDKGYGDVEHIAENPADTQPLMTLLRYGDPLYVERNLKAAKIYHDVLMGINERGGLQFKSNEFNFQEANLHHSAVGQSIYHARTMRHAVWLAWLGLPEAQDIVVRWADNIRDVTMTEIGPKPAGYMPFTIFWPSGSIYPPNDRFWLDPKAHYYGIGAGRLWKYHFGLFSAYYVSGDRKFLEPIDRMFDMATLSAGTAPYDDSLPRDHIKNLLADFSRQPTGDLSSLYRWMTGSSVYDWNGVSSAVQFLIDQDIERFGKTFEPAVEQLRFNFEKMTSEVLQTDRFDIPGDVAIFNGYTGAATALIEDALVPTIAATWDTPDLNFAAVVMSSTSERLRVMVHNFNEQTTAIGVRPWLLVPGEYLVNHGEKQSRGPRPILWEKPTVVTYIHRGTPIFVDVGPRKTWIIDLRLQKRIERPAKLADLAIAKRDIRVSGNDVTVTLHNIGSADAGPFEVLLETDQGGQWKEVARTKVAGLKGIVHLTPVRQDITLPGTSDKLGKQFRVTVDPQNQVDETYKLNNVVTIQR